MTRNAAKHEALLDELLKDSTDLCGDGTIPSHQVKQNCPECFMIGSVFLRTMT